MDATMCSCEKPVPVVQKDNTVYCSACKGRIEDLNRLGINLLTDIIQTQGAAIHTLDVNIQRLLARIEALEATVVDLKNEIGKLKRRGGK